MYITSVDLGTRPLRQNKIHKNKNHLPLELASDSFCCSDKKAFSKKPSFGMFALKDVLKLIKDENLLGIGKTNKAYSLEQLPQFVLRIPNNMDVQKKHEFICRPVKPFCKEYNFGEPVIDFGSGVQLLNKVEGVGCSFKNWIIQMKDTTFRNMPICKSLAKENLNNITKIAEFPIEAYIDLAKKMKFINTTTKAVDCINPNNILINFDSKKFNIIDLWKKGRHQTDGNAGVDHMITLLCDGILHMETLKALPASKAKVYENATNMIIYKCQKAAQLVGLGRSKRDILSTFGNVESMVKSVVNIEVDYRNRYLEFCKKYGI